MSTVVRVYWAEFARMCFLTGPATRVLDDLDDVVEEFFIRGSSIREVALKGETPGYLGYEFIGF